MGKIYCTVCGANWRSSGDGPEAQEHHIDVPCVGESTEFKQRAQIAALKEKLAAVERERDATRASLDKCQRDNQAFIDAGREAPSDDDASAECSYCYKAMPDRGAKLQWCSDACHEAWKDREIAEQTEAADLGAALYKAEFADRERAEKELRALRAELERKDAALKWYAEQVGQCAKFDAVPGGAEARAALAKDVGARARAALQPKEPPCQTA